MENNKYTRALNSVEVSEETLEKGLRYAMENSGRKDKVIRMKKIGNNHWKTAAAAACLAAVVGVGGFIGHSFSAKTENSFIVTANAEEMKTGAEIVFDLVDCGGGSDGVHDGTGRLAVMQSTALPIRCEGENIESVTYTLDSKAGHNTEQILWLSKNYKETVRHDTPDTPLAHSVWIPYSVPTLSYTVAYEDQPHFAANGMALDSNGLQQMDEEAIPVTLMTQFKIEPSLFGFEDHEEWAEALNDSAFHFPNEWYDIMQQLYEEDNNDSKIIVTVNYKDGTSETKTISLSCKAAGSYMEITGTLCDQ